MGAQLPSEWSRIFVFEELLTVLRFESEGTNMRLFIFMKYIEVCHMTKETSWKRGRQLNHGSDMDEFTACLKREENKKI